MIFRKFGKWLLTDAGKNFSFYTATAASAGALLAHFLPHTICVDQYKDLVRLYKKGMTVPINKELQKRFQNTLDLLEVSPEDQHLYQPFHVYGLDVMSAGSSRSRFGVIVGIPINFQYNSVETAYDKPVILVKDKEISWSSENGRKLLQSLILSENAQMYAMAREIKMRQTWKLAFDVIYAVTATTATYTIANHLNVKGNLYSKPRSVRFFMYSLVAAFFTVTYFMLKDITTVTLEKAIDEQLKQMNPIFKEGGKEFYTKIIERNKTLREIMGSTGEKLYTALGNENTLLRTRHLPNVQRKAIFEDTLASENLLS